MVNRQKIIIMSKLAVYDKKLGQADRKADRLFRHDFIYRQNMWTRFYATVVVMIGLVCYWGYQFFTTDMDLFGLDFESMIRQAVMVLGATLVFFTVVGTIKATAEYQSAQARLSRYYKLLNHLDRLDERIRSEEASGSGADTTGA